MIKSLKALYHLCQKVFLGFLFTSFLDSFEMSVIFIFRSLILVIGLLFSVNSVFAIGCTNDAQCSGSLVTNGVTVNYDGFCHEYSPGLKECKQCEINSDCNIEAVCTTIGNSPAYTQSNGYCSNSYVCNGYDFIDTCQDCNGDADCESCLGCSPPVICPFVGYSDECENANDVGSDYTCSGNSLYVCAYDAAADCYGYELNQSCGSLHCFAGDTGAGPGCHDCTGCSLGSSCNGPVLEICGIADENYPVRHECATYVGDSNSIFSSSCDESCPGAECYGNTGCNDETCQCEGGTVPNGQGQCISAATCSDGIKNQGETGVDCGGPCSACPTCSDGIQNQNETGIDCGGVCGACSSCSDGIQNQNETGIDCGGVCGACPTCSDGIQNQNETGVDCGGPCSACASCTDGTQNQGETGVDCGGPCSACPTCSDGIKNQGETGVDCGSVCNTSCAAYQRQLGSWGTCSVSCGGGTQTASFVCVNSSGVVVPENNCTSTIGAKPGNQSQSCNTQACGTVLCSNDADCTGDTGNTCTYYNCINPGTISSSCEERNYAASENQICDSNSDGCPGTCNGLGGCDNDICNGTNECACGGTYPDACVELEYCCNNISRCPGSCPEDYNGGANGCGYPPGTPTCFDGIQNQGEGGVDCGGPCIGGCAGGGGGRCDSDVNSSAWYGDNCSDLHYSSWGNGRCDCVDGIQCSNPGPDDCPYPGESDTYNPNPSTCSDNIQNQGETGVDCGGPCEACDTYTTCYNCIDGSSCSSIGVRNSTCENAGHDYDNIHVCINECGATCDDGKLNQDEEYIDCGGPNCAPCGAPVAYECVPNGNGGQFVLAPGVPVEACGPNTLPIEYGSPRVYYDYGSYVCAPPEFGGGGTIFCGNYSAICGDTFGECKTVVNFSGTYSYTSILENQNTCELYDAWQCDGDLSSPGAVYCHAPAVCDDCAPGDIVIPPENYIYAVPGSDHDDPVTGEATQSITDGGVVVGSLDCELEFVCDDSQYDPNGIESCITDCINDGDGVNDYVATSLGVCEKVGCKDVVSAYNYDPNVAVHDASLCRVCGDAEVTDTEACDVNASISQCDSGFACANDCSVCDDLTPYHTYQCLGSTGNWSKSPTSNCNVIETVSNSFHGAKFCSDVAPDNALCDKYSTYTCDANGSFVETLDSCYPPRNTLPSTPVEGDNFCYVSSQNVPSTICNVCGDGEMDTNELCDSSDGSCLQSGNNACNACALGYTYDGTSCVKMVCNNEISQIVFDGFQTTAIVGDVPTYFCDVENATQYNVQISVNGSAFVNYGGGWTTSSLRTYTTTDPGTVSFRCRGRGPSSDGAGFNNQNTPNWCQADTVVVEPDCSGFEVTLNDQDNYCDGAGSTSYTATVTGGVGPITYERQRQVGFGGTLQAFGGNTSTITSTDTSPSNVNVEYTYQVTATDSQSCSKTVSKKMTVLDTPNITGITTTDATCTEQGTMTFAYEDSTSRSGIRFSTDGGATWTNALDTASPVTISRNAGTYPVLVQWGDGTCGIGAGSHTIGFDTSEIGTTCDDQDPETASSTYTLDPNNANQCLCEGAKVCGDGIIQKPNDEGVTETCEANSDCGASARGNYCESCNCEQTLCDSTTIVDANGDGTYAVGEAITVTCAGTNYDQMNVRYGVGTPSPRTWVGASSGPTFTFTPTVAGAYQINCATIKQTASGSNVTERCAAARPEVCADTDGDGVCNDDEITGCTNPESGNYNEDATDDDGSCRVCGNGTVDEDEVCDGTIGCTTTGANACKLCEDGYIFDGSNKCVNISCGVNSGPILYDTQGQQVNDENMVVGTQIIIQCHDNDPLMDDVVKVVYKYPPLNDTRQDVGGYNSTSTTFPFTLTEIAGYRFKCVYRGSRDGDGEPRSETPGGGAGSCSSGRITTVAPSCSNTSPNNDPNAVQCASTHGSAPTEVDEDTVLVEECTTTTESCPWECDENYVLDSTLKECVKDCSGFNVTLSDQVGYCDGAGTTSYTTSVTGGIGALTYEWTQKVGSTGTPVLFGGNTSSITSTDTSPSNVNVLYTYEVTVTDSLGCEATASDSFTVLDTPDVSVSTTDATCSEGGSLGFDFVNSRSRTGIEFSIDGGTSRPASASVGDATSPYIWNLDQGAYDVVARRGDNSCPIDLGSYTIGFDTNEVGNTCTTLGGDTGIYQETSQGVCECICEDKDGDGVCNDADSCPEDPSKTTPGTCGCGIVDTDGDGVCDDDDNCPSDQNPNQGDIDEDGIGDYCDSITCSESNAPGNATICAPEYQNPTGGNDQGIPVQDCANTAEVCPWICNDGYIIDPSTGEDCCEDSDQDGVCNYNDNCPDERNQDQGDIDQDGIGDYCDLIMCSPSDGPNNATICPPEYQNPTGGSDEGVGVQDCASTTENCPWECIDGFTYHTSLGYPDCCADIDANGVCDTNEIPGCMDPNAHNYNPSATISNGTCKVCSDNIHDQEYEDCDEDTEKCDQDTCTCAEGYRYDFATKNCLEEVEISCGTYGQFDESLIFFTPDFTNTKNRCIGDGAQGPTSRANLLLSPSVGLPNTVTRYCDTEETILCRLNITTPNMCENIIGYHMLQKVYGLEDPPPKYSSRDIYLSPNQLS